MRLDGVLDRLVLARPADKDVFGYDIGACVAHNSPLLTIVT